MDMQHFQSVFAQAKAIAPPPVGTIPGRSDLKGIPYFEYGSYFLGDEFQKLCPSAVPIGIGWLASWTWHINARGLPNVRPVSSKFQTIWNGPVISPSTWAPKIVSQHLGTYGIIYIITPEDLEVLNVKLYDRTKLVQRIECAATKVSKPRLESKYMNLNMHFDPRNTADAFIDLWKNNDEKEKWKRGLGMLQLFSIPNSYLRKIQCKLSGSTLNADLEPVTLSFPTFQQNRMLVKSSTPPLLLQVGENQHRLRGGKQQIVNNRLHALKEQHRLRKQNIRRQNNTVGRKISRDTPVHKQVSKLVNSHRNGVRKPSPLSQSPLVPLDPQLSQDQRNTQPPHNVGNEYLLSRTGQNLEHSSHESTRKKIFVDPFENDHCLPLDTYGLKFVVVTEKDKRSSLQELIQTVEFPAMKNHPVRISMFPNTNKKAEEEEINYLVDRLRETLKLPGTTYFKTILPDGTPVALIGFTVWNSEKDPKSGALSIVAKKENKSYWHPSTTNVAALEELSAKLSEERSKGLKTSLKASKRATKIMCLDTFAVAPEYQKQGIGFMLMQWYCQEMLKYKLGSFLFAPAEACDMLTQFYFNAGRKIQIAKGILTCMYRAHNAPIPTAHSRPPHDHEPIETSERNYRPDEVSREKVSDVPPLPAKPASRLTIVPAGSMDMPPPPKPLNKKNPAASNKIKLPPKPIDKSSEERTTQINNLKKNEKRKDRHDSYEDDASKGPQTKIQKTNAQDSTSAYDFELVVQDNGRAELKKKNFLAPQQVEKLRTMSAEPQDDTNIDEWGLIVENGKAVVKKQSMPPQYGSRQETQLRGSRAPPFSPRLGGMTSGQALGPSMHSFNHPRCSPGHPSNFLHNQWLSDSTSKPTRPPQVYPTPLLPNSGVRANGRPDLPEVTVGPRLHSSNFRGQQIQPPITAPSNCASVAQKPGPGIKSPSHSTHTVEGDKILRPFDKYVDFAALRNVGGQANTIRNHTSNNQVIGEQQCQPLSIGPINFAAATAAIGRQASVQSPSISGREYEGQHAYVPSYEPIDMVSTAGGQQHQILNPTTRSHIGGQKEDNASFNPPPEIVGKHSHTQTYTPYYNSATFGGQQVAIPAPPLYPNIYGQDSLPQQTTFHNPCHSVPEQIVSEEQWHNSNHSLFIRRQQQSIAQSPSFDSAPQFDGDYNPEVIPDFSSYSQDHNTSQAGQHYSPQIHVSSVGPQDRFGGLQNCNSARVPTSNTRGCFGEQLYPNNTSPATFQGQFLEQPIQNTLQNRHVMPQRVPGGHVQSPLHAPPIVPQVTAHNLEDARKRNPNLRNIPDDVLRKILSEHLGGIRAIDGPRSGVHSTSSQHIQQFQLPLFPPSIHIEQIRFAIRGYRLGYPQLAKLRDDQIGIIILQNMRKINAEQVEIFRQLLPDLAQQNEELVRFEIVHRMSGFSPTQVQEVRQLDPQLSFDEDYQIRLHIVQNILQITPEEVQVARQRNPHMDRHTNGSVRYYIFKHRLQHTPGTPPAAQESMQSSNQPYISPQAPEYSPISDSWTPLKRKAADDEDNRDNGSPSKRQKR